MVDDDEVVTTDRQGSNDEGFDDDGVEFVPAEIKTHLGKNLFAQAKKEYGTVDIRHFFFTNSSTKSLHPTRRGVTLSTYEFSKLLHQLPDIEKRWQGLQSLEECGLTHKGMTALMRCLHCTPQPPPSVDIVPAGSKKNPPHFPLKKKNAPTPKQRGETDDLVDDDKDAPRENAQEDQEDFLLRPVNIVPLVPTAAPTCSTSITSQKAPPLKRHLKFKTKKTVIISDEESKSCETEDEGALTADEQHDLSLTKKRKTASKFVLDEATENDSSDF